MPYSGDGNFLFDRNSGFPAPQTMDHNGGGSPLGPRGSKGKGSAMSNRALPRFTGLGFGVMISGVMMMTMPALADGLKDEIAPTGKLRVAIGISPAGGAFWSNKTESGAYAGVSVDLG